MSVVYECVVVIILKRCCKIEGSLFLFLGHPEKESGSNKMGRRA